MAMVGCCSVAGASRTAAPFDGKREKKSAPVNEPLLHREVQLRRQYITTSEIRELGINATFASCSATTTVTAKCSMLAGIHSWQPRR
ncbi:hypothetical protein SETIT_3G307800v2 [Setaria italica]|uniref:Uncharacterized protein n=1 Tax=Setaria italica TaxID=4555 RepID=K3ZC82_SETIT|nr:hypothetical protein SETIT_3G307800v2 [Setaria italica]